MNLDTLGYGAGGGMLVALLGAFGIVRKVERLEDSLSDKIDKAGCDRCSKASNERFESIDKKLDMILEYLIK